MRRPHLIVALAAVAAAAFSAAGIADAKAFFHAKLLKSNPADHDTLRAGPKVIALWYSEHVELSLSSGKLTDSKGAAVSLAAPTIGMSGDTSVVVYAIPKPLAAGPYSFAWTAAGKDGHASKGSIGFVIRATR